MSELIDWLRIQLDEDERVARKAANHGLAWRDSDGSIYPSNVSQHPGSIITGVYGDLHDGHAEHIARWDPARVLAEVESKRRILERYEATEDEILSPDAWVVMREVIEVLAHPYAGRPGWREEWRIDD